MNAQIQAPRYRNFRKAPCSVCDAMVPAKAGYYVGKRPNGAHDIRCASPTCYSADLSLAGLPVVPTHHYVAIDASALDAATAIYVQAVVRGDGRGAALAFQWATACAYMLGVAVPDLDALVTGEQAKQAASDSIVDDILGRSPDDGPEQREAEIERADAFRRAAMQTSNTLANAGVRAPASTHTNTPRARTPRASHKPASTRMADRWTPRGKEGK